MTALERVKEKYLNRADRDIEKAFELLCRDHGIALFCQSSGFMRYGVNAKLEMKPLVDNSLPDPTDQTPSYNEA